MSVTLNHSIVWCHDEQASAAFLVDILALAPPVPFGNMLVVRLDNEVSLDFYPQQGEIASQHYAFLTSESEFDAAFARLQLQGLDYWADPGRSQANQTYQHNGGRGCYFLDPDGHFLEIMTRPYQLEDQT